MKLKLPNYWKKIAGILLLVTFLFLIANKFYNFIVDKTILVQIGKISFTLAGFLFIMSKERKEDEYIIMARLQAFSAAFIFGIVGYIIDESGLSNFLGEENSHDMFRFILVEIFTYIGFFYGILYRVIKFEK